jgi:hypothetical protein
VNASGWLSSLSPVMLLRLRRNEAAAKRSGRMPVPCFEFHGIQQKINGCAELALHIEHMQHRIAPKRRCYSILHACSPSRDLCGKSSSHTNTASPDLAVEHSLACMRRFSNCMDDDTWPRN